MTRNQIEYWNLQELRRSNQAKELETHRANVAQEREKERSNRAQEELTLYSTAEAQRHNTEMEQYNLMSLEELARHNTVTEGEAFRSDVAREEENRRHNIESEAISRSSVSAQYAQIAENRRHNVEMEELQEVSNGLTFEKIAYDYNVSLKELDKEQQKIDENIRHSKAQESETERSNKAKEEENHRHNTMEEYIEMFGKGSKFASDVAGAVSKGLAFSY